MGWQTLSASLRRWDTAGGSSSPGEPSLAEVEAAVEEVLADSNDEEALQLFTEAMDPKLQRGSGFLRSLAQADGAKCRCDAVWYGDTIAYGCKTCGLSSASCICVFCFDAGDHEGHDFYISRSDYGCCDCGDAYAWRQSGFCRHHPGPRKDVDPARLLPEATRRRARLLIPAQVKRLVRFQPNVFPASRSESSRRGVPREQGLATSEYSGSAGDAAASDAAAGARAEAASALPEGEESALADSSTAAASVDDGTQDSAEEAMQEHRVLVTGVNLRVIEDQLRDYFADRTREASVAAQRAASEAAAAGNSGGVGAAAGDGALNLVAVPSREPPILRVELARDAETKASKGRAYITFRDKAAVDAALQASGETLRGSRLRIHAGAEAIVAAERHLHAWETNFEWLLSLGGFHDGLRKIIGQVFLEEKLEDDQSPVEVLLKQSHMLEPSVRKLETNLMVDLMLDLDFKHRFAQVFTRLYRTLVLARAGNQDTNELGDFTCQIFTRQDVTLELVREHGLVRNLLGCLWDLLRPALVQGALPIVFNHESNIFRDHEIIQCSMDLLYVLDHAEVAREIIRMPNLRGDLWEGWVRILIAMQAMNPHKRRSGAHVEFTSVAWGNALTLHTDLMSNTWLMLDAVESKAELDAVQDMARWTWTELRAWMINVHFAENRTGSEALVEYSVSSQPTSFHVPVNRILALLLHHLCVRSAEAVGCVPGQTPLQAAFVAVGLTSEADVLWWMEHPLRALVLHSQVSAGMWRRNGEALENESEFYRMNYWHHLLVDMDLLVLRMAGMVISPENFFRTLLLRFENRRWLEPGDPLSWLSGNSGHEEDEFALQKLQSFVLLLHQLLSSHTPLSLNFQQMVMHTTRQYLSIGPRSHSQLWDPRLERSTATSTAKDQQMLESALREISTFSEADGAGHSSAKYHLKANQWSLVDPYFHLFSWSEQQKSEENLMSALKARGETLLHWLSESAKLQPQPFEVYRPSFFKFSTSGLVQAVCWLLLVKLAFKHLKDNGTVADGRLLVLALHLALRSVQAPKEVTSGSHEAGILTDDLAGENADGDPVHIGEDEVQLFRLAGAMGPHLCSSARRRFRVSTAAFFDAQLLAGNPTAPHETEISLLDALERLSMAPEENVSGGLARGLHARLLQDQQNFNVSRSRPRPWFAPAPAPTSDSGEAENGAAAGTRPNEPESGLSHDEARRAKRRRAAQERQQRMLDDLKKRQAAFITGAQGQRMLEEAGAHGAGTSGGEGGGAAECVVCISQQEGEDGDNPLGLLCFLRPAVASCLPRERLPPERAVLLQAPKSPVAEPQGNRGPQCFAPQAPDGLLLARSCSHRMHFLCWRRFRPGALASSGGRFTCPYCGTVSNALLPVAAPGDNPKLSLEESRAASCVPESADMDLTAAPVQVSNDGTTEQLSPHSRRPMRHADASEDFTEQLGLHMQKLGSRHAPPEYLATALGFTGGSADRKFLALARLCADNITLAEVRLRTRRQSPSVSSSATASAAAGATGPPTSYMPDSTATLVLRCVAAEALQGAPDTSAQVVALMAEKMPVLQAMVGEATPHGRFQCLTALLMALAINPGSVSQSVISLTAKSLLHAFYVAEAAFALSPLAADDFCEQQLATCTGDGSSVRAAFWQLLHDQLRERRSVDEEESSCPAFTPVQSLAEASHVLKLALNQFLTKVHILLSLLNESYRQPPETASHLGAASTLAHEHQLLACGELGLLDVDSMLFDGSGTAAPQAAEQLAVQLLKCAVYAVPRRGLQPSSPILLVLVADGAEAAPSFEDDEPPAHVWQVTSESFDRLTAVTGRSEVLQLEAPQGIRGRLYCMAYRLTLPVITGKVYQKFYTQFVHARCTVCHSSPAIPTICLLCGTFLCCNSECCRRRPDGEDSAANSSTTGEVTQHAQVCGFGTCVFLQLSNSLVHIVADGFIACWGSLYLDGHGEEEYNLGSPLYISEARLQQLTQSIREVSFDFESRLKWKKVIFV